MLKGLNMGGVDNADVVVHVDFCKGKDMGMMGIDEPEEFLPRLGIKGCSPGGRECRGGVQHLWSNWPQHVVLQRV